MKANTSHRSISIQIKKIITCFQQLIIKKTNLDRHDWRFSVYFVWLFFLSFYFTFAHSDVYNMSVAQPSFINNQYSLLLCCHISFAVCVFVYSRSDSTLPPSFLLPLFSLRSFLLFFLSRSYSTSFFSVCVLLLLLTCYFIAVVICFFVCIA